MILVLLIFICASVNGYVVPDKYYIPTQQHGIQHPFVRQPGIRYPIIQHPVMQYPAAYYPGLQYPCLNIQCDFACCFYYYSPPAPMYIPQFQGAQFPVLAPFYLPYHTINYPSFGSHQLTGYAGYARYPSIYPGIKPVQASTQKPWRPTEASTVKPTTPIISPVEPVVPEVTTESSTLATLFKNKFSGATTTPGDIIDIDDEDISLKHDIDEVIEGSGGSATNDDED